MRKIPATMATQHPDNALAPYWDKNGNPFISAYQEIEEAIHCFQDLGVSEYMWDWEGKHADAAVVDRMFSDYHDYFAKNQLGRDKFLTFRIPNIWEEKGYNLLLAMTVILSGEDFAKDLKYANRPLFEVILPMTTRAEQLMRVHSLFEKLAQFKSSDFTKKEPDNTDHLEVIPLVESVQDQLAVGELLKEYSKLHQDHFGHKPEYIRPFLACSDSSLSAGSLAGIIGNKLALSRLYEFSGQTGIDVYPIAGPGSLMFRGGLSPSSIDRFLDEMPGVRTATIQSSFRYDNALEEVKAAVSELEAKLPKTQPKIINQADQDQLVAIAELSSAKYQSSLQEIIGEMQPIFRAIPKRRDRRQHIGLLAYGRSVSGEKLPRAITFTGGFYSIGIPPEFIGLGRALREMNSKQLEILKDNYKSLANDLVQAGRFLNKDNLKNLAKQNAGWNQIISDVESAETILDLSFAPETADEKAHQQLSLEILNTRNNPEKLSQLIEESASLRKSIG